MILSDAGGHYFQVRSADKYAHFDRLAYVMVLPGHGDQVKGVVAEFGFGRDNMWTWSDHAVEVHPVGRFTDHGSVNLNGLLQALAAEAVAVDVQPGLMGRRCWEGFQRGIDFGAVHGD